MIVRSCYNPAWYYPIVEHHVGYRRELKEQQVLNQSHRRLYVALSQAEEQAAAGMGQDGPGEGLLQVRSCLGWWLYERKLVDAQHTRALCQWKARQNLTFSLNRNVRRAALAKIMELDISISLYTIMTLFKFFPFFYIILIEGFLRALW